MRFYGLFSFFGTFAHNVAQTWFVLHETWNLKSLSYPRELRVKLQFYGFLSFFCTFAYKVAQTWFVLHESLKTTLFGIYYFVEVVRIESHTHMLEITC